MRVDELDAEVAGMIRERCEFREDLSSQRISTTNRGT